MRILHGLYLILSLSPANTKQIGPGNISFNELPTSVPMAQRIANLQAHNSHAFASSLINQPVYISLTTVTHRIQGLPRIIKQLLDGTMLPTHIYIVISTESYLMDDGISNKTLSKELLGLMHIYPVSIVYTENIGPHRKLLPLLNHKW